MQRSSLMFITRKFPPSTGGMETLSNDIAVGLSELRDISVVALGRSQAHLIWFAPFAVVRVLLACLRAQSLQVIYGDALIYTLVGSFIPSRCASSNVVACGLDVTWPNRLYQRSVGAALRHADAVLPISQATAAEVEKRGTESHRIRMINLGIALPSYDAPTLDLMRVSTRASYAIGDDDLLVVSVGRLVERKGILWFLEQVVPLLDENVVILVAGDGPLRSEIERATRGPDVNVRVEILGRVSDTDRDGLLAAADIFVMPNIPVEGDMEGFGLAAPEAAMFDSVVIASRLEGLVDAVDDGETGVFCGTRDADCFASTINRFARDLASVQSTGIQFGRNARNLKGRDAMSASIMEQLGV